MSELRLQKFLAQCGVASRRKAEELILRGRVTVNSKTISELGSKVDPQKDQIRLDGKSLKIISKHSYYLFHKPRRVMVTKQDPEKRKTVYDLLPQLDAAMNAVGRLDYDSEGLLLFTNDGELAYRLTHPSYEIKKIYEVQLKNLPDPKRLLQLEKGIELEGEKTSPAKIRRIADSDSIWFSIQIHEGKKRQVRRMFEWAGSRVVRLVRVQLGVLNLDETPSGKGRVLSKIEISLLKKSVAMD